MGHLAMDIAMIRPTQGITTHNEPIMVTSFSIALHALHLLINDWQTMITSLVKKECDAAERTGEPGKVQHAERRRKVLKEWLQSDQPFAWSPRGISEHVTYKQIIAILNDDHSSVPKALCESSTSLTYDMLARCLCSMDRTGLNVSAPVPHGGAFIGALPLALDLFHIKARAIPEIIPTGVALAEMAFSTMLRRMKIELVPWHKEMTTAGRRMRAVSTKAWLLMSTTPSSSMVPFSPQEVQEQQLSQVVANIASHDPSAPWSVPTVLSDMGVLWRKMSLPREWSLENASSQSSAHTDDGAHIHETYKYVAEKYDGNLWWHHMALVWAILFSRVPPNLFPPKDYPYESLSSAADITQQIRNVPWVATGKSRGGVSEWKPFIPLLSTSIIALLDADSPLRVYMCAHKDAMGSSWTNKHGVLYLFIVCIELIDYYQVLRELPPSIWSEWASEKREH